MSVPYAMLKAYQPTQGVQMDEFFTAETYYNEQMAEFAAEQEWEKMQEKLAPFDPYDDYDDQGNEDAGWEEGLFGWE